MADGLESRSSSNNDGKISETIATPASGRASEPEVEEIYPPAREVVPILLAMASSIFLVSLVSSLFPFHGRFSC
jgi:hypothetical protein